MSFGGAFGPETVIDNADGTSDQTHVRNMRTNTTLSLHLTTDGTLTGANGWKLEFTNGPETDNRTATGPVTSEFDWVDSGLTFTVPAGSATNQFVHVENILAKWVRVKWDATGASGSGNVSASVMSKG